MYYAEFGDDMDGSQLKKCATDWLPEAITIDKTRIGAIEKLHATSNFAKKEFTMAQCQELVRAGAHIASASTRHHRKTQYSTTGAHIVPWGV